MELSAGIEPAQTHYESVVLPLDDESMVGVLRLELKAACSQSMLSTIGLHPDRVAELLGFEPRHRFERLLAV